MLCLLPRASVLILAILTMSFFFPAGFDKVFTRQIDAPLLFYSPLLKQFIFQESLGNHQFNYMDEDGTIYSRPEFEDQLPFLYYRNLERRNLLPISIDGQLFDTQDIAKDRQGLEIKARHLRGHFPQMQLYPLFNNDPEVAMMSFPVELFRFTDRAMEFVNADDNRIDLNLTDLFTKVLKEKGFVFPAKVIGGKPTNLKPFDDGYFILDSVGQVFHVKQVMNRPEVIKTPIDPKLDILDIVISENERREFHGVIITRQGRVFLISWNGYRLIPLPVEGYDPAHMDFKLLINPLYRTAIVSSNYAISGVAMDADYQPIRRYELSKTDHAPALVRHAREFLFPFQLTIDSPYRGQAAARIEVGGLWSLAGILKALIFFFLFSRRKFRDGLNMMDLAAVLLGGFFGLAATVLNRDE
jgi:hypothetical protein